MDTRETFNQTGPPSKFKKKLWLRIALWILMAVMVAAIGALLWQIKVISDKNSQYETERQQLQNQINNLRSQLALQDTDPELDEDTAACTNQALNSLKQTIKGAVETKDWASLQEYMASQVDVTYAATEKGGKVSPSQAVVELGYLNKSVSPWNFNLNKAYLDEYKKGDYSQYVPDGNYIGKASNNFLVSFGFNNCKINMIFIDATV